MYPLKVSPWHGITIVSGVNGTGTGQVTYLVAASTAAARTGTVKVAGQTFTVNQAAAPAPPACTVVVKPLSLEVSADEQKAKVDVDTTMGCAWTATSGVRWITIESGATGSGRGEVHFLIDENKPAMPRTGTLTVASQTVTVVQRRN